MHQGQSSNLFKVMLRRRVLHKKRWHQLYSNKNRDDTHRNTNERNRNKLGQEIIPTNTGDNACFQQIR